VRVGNVQKNIYVRNALLLRPRGGGKKGGEVTMGERSLPSEKGKLRKKLGGKKPGGPPKNRTTSLALSLDFLGEDAEAAESVKRGQK